MVARKNLSSDRQKPKWHHRCGCYWAEIAGGALRLQVNYERAGYTVLVNDRQLRASFPDLRAGQIAAMGLALKIMGEVTEDLTVLAEQARDSSSTERDDSKAAE